MDTRLYGTLMCDNWTPAYTNCGSGHTIAVGQQEWSTGIGITYGTTGTDLTVQGSQACIDNNIPVRTAGANYSGNDPVYFGVAVPGGQAPGSYSGQTTFSAAAGNTCP
jgi:hypothetical protein